MSDKPEKPLPFVVTDRRKFTTEGEPRPDADPSPERESRHAEPPPPAPGPVSAPPAPTPIAPPAAAVSASQDPDEAEDGPEGDLPPAPTAEQMEQSRTAFEATAERLDVAIRAANPGADHPPAMSFEQLVQSVYMQAILQLGGGTQEGQPPQVDILGARQSIDMLGILSDKTAGNLSATEQNLLTSALFELRLAFLEITQALARQAQQRAQQTGPQQVGPQGSPMAGGPPSGPRIVR